MLTTVESHVLEEVSETALGVVFLNRTYLLSDVEVCLVLGFLIVADVVGQAVVEFANLHCRVNGKWGHLLCCSRNGNRCYEQEQEGFDFFHNVIYFVK